MCACMHMSTNKRFPKTHHAPFVAALWLDLHPRAWCTLACGFAHHLDNLQGANSTHHETFTITCLTMIAITAGADPHLLLHLLLRHMPLFSVCWLDFDLLDVLEKGHLGPQRLMIDMIGAEALPHSEPATGPFKAWQLPRNTSYLLLDSTRLDHPLT